MSTHRRRAAEALPMLDHRADFPSMARVQSPPIVRKFGRIAAAVFVAYVLLILVLPWQQFVRGSGRVVAYDPLERPQVLEAPLSGRLVVSNVVEGQRVSAGEVLFEMADNDPELRANLEAQRVAAEAKLEAAALTLTGLRAQLAQKQEALPEAVAAAEQKLDAARFAARTAALQFERIRGLYENPLGGLVSQREVELATLERDRTAASLAQAEAEGRKAELDGRADLESTRASIEKARGDSASAAQSLASIRSRVNETERLRVVAPRDGIVSGVTATQGTFLSAGKALATLVPDTENRTVELWLDGNDVPLVHARELNPDGTVAREGSPVRLQFEGWPAVQFVGWPSVARGTFGGEVALIDPADDGTGRFRVLVAPKPDVVNDGRDIVPWPGPRWLRQGAQVNGWVLLNRVPLWYEIWRQLNGFPPALTEAPAGAYPASGSK